MAHNLSLYSYSKGNFLYAKIATVYESQEAEAKFSGISINKDGEYIIEYQTFIYCDNLDETECNRQSARDFIQVSLKNNGNLQLAAKFTQKLRRWTKVSHSVQLTQGTIDVILNGLNLKSEVILLSFRLRSLSFVWTIHLSSQLYNLELTI